MTNWDKIKTMDISSIAKMFNEGCPPDIDMPCGERCIECWENWLRSDIVLKACPFCGKNVAHTRHLCEGSTNINFSYPNYYEVICDYIEGGCGTTLGGEYKTEEEAIKAWNTRF